MDLQIPEKFSGLFEPHRYKVLYGGRGAGRSWNCARALLAQGAQGKELVLCAREFQNSISDSVHALLSNQIEHMKLGWFYEIQNTEIIGKNGTSFIFAGLRHNINTIRSLEGVTRCWVEEAQNVSKASWDVLIPTIRTKDSEIWMTFNPGLESDETYKRFVVKPPKDALVIKTNYDDNPWFPEVLRREMEELRARDEDSYLHVWEGFCRQMLDGAIYANELRGAQQDGRICKVPYDPSKPVDVFLDLGWSDNTSCIFAQKIGFEYRALHGYQNRHQNWQHYLSYIQSRGYVIGTVWLPHDARAKSLGTGRSIEELTRAAGFTTRVVPMLSVEDGIQALRTIFPLIYWDEIGCADALQALRHYRYDVDPVTGKYSKKPLHDEHSHFADAARYMGVALTEKKSSAGVPKTIRLEHFPTGSLGWMA